jgi:hypothetical protein
MAILFGTPDAQMREERNWRQTFSSPAELSPDSFESPQRKLEDPLVDPQARARGFRGSSSRRQNRSATAVSNSIAIHGPCPRMWANDSPLGQHPKSLRVFRGDLRRFLRRQTLSTVCYAARLV